METHQKYILTGFLLVALVLVGTFLFQQYNSSESETTSISHKEDNSKSQETVSATQKSATGEPVTVTGKISVSFE